MTKEERREYHRKWEANNKDRRAIYSARQSAKKKQQRKGGGRVSWSRLSDPKRDRKLFIKTTHLAKNKITRRQFQSLSPEKIQKLNFKRIEMVGK